MEIVIHQTGTVEVVEYDAKTGAGDDPQGGHGDPASDWPCSWCRRRVASEKDRFEYQGQREFIFRNPAGIRFHLIAFSRTFGCRRSGMPTLEDTWFPGHAWSFCLCGGCHLQLGWYYSGTGEFAGLILERIVRAAHVRN